MPYVRIEITDEDVADDDKARVIAGVTELLQRVLGKDPAATFVVIDEVPVGNWGIGGVPVTEWRTRRSGEVPVVVSGPLAGADSGGHVVADREMLAGPAQQCIRPVE